MSTSIAIMVNFVPLGACREYMKRSIAAAVPGPKNNHVVTA